MLLSSGSRETNVWQLLVLRVVLPLESTLKQGVISHSKAGLVQFKHLGFMHRNPVKTDVYSRSDTTTGDPGAIDRCGCSTWPSVYA
jgi:hypothetical protein